MIDLYSHKSEKLNHNILLFSRRNMKAKDSIVNYSEIKFKNMEDARKLEWIETNGLGGWASSTVYGLNTRRYHGLLIAAKNPPVGRINLLSKLDETVIVNGQDYQLGSNQYPGVVHPNGFEYLKSFRRDLFPEFYYECGEVNFKKTITSINNENTTLIIYEIITAPANSEIEFRPFVAGRDYHSLSHANDSINRDPSFEKGILKLQPYDDGTLFYISVPNSEFIFHPDWYYNFAYELEKYRGLGFLEDLFCYGVFKKKIKSGDKFGIIISTDNPNEKDSQKLFFSEETRRKQLVSGVDDEFVKILTLAADQFIVKRKEKLRTIIAGYHWFTDWGRDTMIALPGLTLSTGRYNDAKKILLAFAESINEGMIPNRFPDNNETPEYNTVDASLWFFVAAKKYYDYTKNIKFISEVIYPALEEIIDWYYKGTRYNIHVDKDGLLSAGETGTQITWMDAKVGDWVVTPRNGKTVELNALWYNALLIYAELLMLLNSEKASEHFKSEARKVKRAFARAFWNKKKDYLYDVINGDKKDDSIRPNQIFAISLPYQLISEEKAKKVLEIVNEHLLTPVGLRSLSPSDPNYKSFYGGGQYERDGAYHQGTVWSWLLGPYIDALLKTNGESGKAEAKEIIKRFKPHLSQAGIGTISEIFDGNEPHHPRGCIAQAWGIAEILRVVNEYELLK